MTTIEPFRLAVLETAHMTARPIFNVLAVCGTAVFTGMLLTIGLTLGPYWKSLPPAEFLDWFSRHSHLVGQTIAPVLFPTLLGLAGSLWLGWSDARRRHLWGAALVCILVLLVVTSIYNGPLNGQFVSKAVPPDEVPAALDTWLRAHAARVALGLAASVLGVLAVSR